MPDMLTRLLLLCLVVLVAAGPTARQANEKFLIGVGKGDITGPVVEIGFMGYASLDQKGTGLRQRLYARSFIVANPANPTDRVVYASIDTQSGDTAIRFGILQALQSKYGGLYSQKNVAIVGTHSHSGPGAWLNYLLPQITCQGFDKQSYQAIVDGTVLSIQRAHDSLAEGYLSVATGNVTNGNINRSLYAYLANPQSERDQYVTSVDTEMTMLRFVNAASGKEIGSMNWFPVHGTSLYNNNTLVTGDNKGVAAYYLEQEKGPGYVAGHSQANVGDTSPNTEGPICQDTGLPCRFEDSTCDGKSQQCWGRGPAFRISDTESCRVIGDRQYQTASSILKSMALGAEKKLSGGAVKSFHQFVDFGAPYAFSLPNGTSVTTCKAALGFSFAAGTTDGPGAADFVQNDPGAPSNPFWLLVRDFLHTPGPEQRKCHGQKPILLDVGEMHTPYDWSPNIVDIQLFRIGQLAIVVSPGEATTMSGRRWRAAVKAELAKQNIVPSADSVVVLGGPANSYTHYIATPEEYNIQRYEGASTMYGPWTLPAYIDLSLKNIPFLADGATAQPEAGPFPPINTNSSLSLITGVVYDNPPIFKKFGQVLAAPKPLYYRGQTANATFVGANPRNNLRLEGTYLSVEKLGADGTTWTQVRSDADWHTVYRWERTNGLTGESKVTLEWEVEGDAEEGTYRFRYYGDSKQPVTGKISAFEGVSPSFQVM